MMSIQHTDTLKIFFFRNQVKGNACIWEVSNIERRQIIDPELVTEHPNVCR